jgi:hypothetical protein
LAGLRKINLLWFGAGALDGIQQLYLSIMEFQKKINCFGGQAF